MRALAEPEADATGGCSSNMQGSAFGWLGHALSTILLLLSLKLMAAKACESALERMRCMRGVLQAAPGCCPCEEEGEGR